MHFTEYEKAEIKVFLFWDYIGDYQAQQQEDCCPNWPNPPPLPLVHRHFFFPFFLLFSLLCMFTFVVYKTVYHFTAMSYFCAAYRSKQRPSLHTSKWNKHSSCIRMRWDHDYLVDSVEWHSQNKFLFLLCCVLLTCFPRASLSPVNLTALMIFT